MIRLTNLTHLMRQHHITIRQLATFMDVTMKRVREVRNGAIVSPGVAFDYQDAVFRLVASRVPAKAQQEADMGIDLLRQAIDPVQCPDDLAQRLTAMAVVHLNAAVHLNRGGVVCPGCSGIGVLTDDPQVEKCTRCGGVFTNPAEPITAEQAMKFVALGGPMLANAGDEGQFYFDLDVALVDGNGSNRRHGWADAATKRVVQWG